MHLEKVSYQQAVVLLDSYVTFSITVEAKHEQNTVLKPSVPSRISCHGLAYKGLLHGFDGSFPELRSNLKRWLTFSCVT